MSKSLSLKSFLLCLFLLSGMLPLAGQFRFPVQQSRVKSHYLDADTMWMGTSNGVVKMLRNGQLLAKWTPEDFPYPGFPGTSPSAMTLDNVGRLLVYYDFWGIRRFDGNQWEILTDPFTPDIGSLSFFDICTDSENRILLGGGSAIYRQNGAAWEKITPPFNTHNRLKRGPNGDIWVCSNGFIAHFDGINWTTSEAALPNKRYSFDFTWDASGDLFAIFYPLNTLIPEVWKFPQGDLAQPLMLAIPEYTQTQIPAVSYAETIAIDALGHIWLGVAGPDFNFIRWDGDAWTELGGFSNSPFPQYAYSEARMTPDPDGSMWICSRINADPLYRYSDDSGWQVYDNSLEALAYAGVVGLDGNLWFGGPRFIGHYDPATQEYRHKALAGNSDVVHDMAVSALDSAVFAATESGLYEFDGQNWTLSQPLNAEPMPVVSVTVGADYTVWASVGTGPGTSYLCARSTDGSWQNVSLSAPIAALAAAPDSSIWAAAYDHIFQYKNGVFTIFDALTTGYPFAGMSGTLDQIDVDQTGRVWTFVPGVGMARYDGVQWSVLTKENSGLYAYHNLEDMVFDAQGNLWLTFSNGGAGQRALQVFNGSTWRTFSNYNSTIGPYAIQRIAPAPDGRIWLHDGYNFYYFQPLPRRLQGTLRRDTNENCFPESAEPPLPQWIARAIAPDGEKFYTITTPEGFYELALDSSLYTVTLLPPAIVWGNCDASETIDLTQVVADTLDFSADVLSECPLMQVEIDVPFLRRCFPNTYQIRYCNFGTAAADNAVVDLTIPPELALQHISLPYTLLPSGAVQVVLGNVTEGACGDFSMTVVPDCNAALGVTVCVEAHITPDTLCQGSPGWSGADIHAEATCSSDTVYFLLRNKGFGNMIEAQDYVIIEDEVIMRVAPVQVPMGDSVQIAFPITSGYQRIQVPQEPGHPFPGLVSAFVQGCNGQSGSAFVAQYPFGQPSPFYAQTCAPIQSAFDPNDKLATPTGVKAAHYIWPGTALDYKIRFQNTGNDTAFTVVIRDTLSPWLDVATFRPGAASHAYNWDISGSGILTFTFNPISLPDSNVNEAASHGFLCFNITPADSTPLGTLLENKAGIFFDFNDPVLTNTVFHTLDTGFLAYNMVNMTTDVPSVSLLSVSPNPAYNQVWVSISGHFLKNGSIRLYDVYGRQVSSQTFQGNRVSITRNGLPSGVYVAEIFEQGKWVGAGRILW